MKYLISTSVLGLAVCMTPAIAAANSYNTGYSAHDACKRGEDNRQVLGGLAGAVAGGVFGSQVAGSGARTEGSAIGAVLGGLAGAGIADKTIDCDPVYTPSRGYPEATSQYGTTSSYGSTPTTYKDRVTVSNHPVYSEPHYGAGAVSQGHTYSAGTVSYPPSGHNSQYASTSYSAPSYQAPVTTTRTYSQVQPIAQRVVYSAPVHTGYVHHRPHKIHKVRKAYKPRRAGHYHGSHGCDMGH